MKPFIIAILVTFTITGAGCKLLRPGAGRQTTVTIREMVRDTAVVIAADTASVMALFECDSLNQVVMRALEIERGRKITPLVEFRDKILRVTLPVDSEAVYFTLRSRFEQRTDTIYIGLPAPGKQPGTSKLTWLIRLLAALVILPIVLKLISLFKKR